MSILQDFYSLVSPDNAREDHIFGTSSEHSIQIKIHRDHHIFEGHFPNNPVTPGVCMLQIIKELSERHTGKQLKMTKARNIKFMAIINPEIQPSIEVQLLIDSNASDSGQYQVKSTFTFEDPSQNEVITALKFSGTFQDHQ